MSFEVKVLSLAHEAMQQFVGAAIQDIAFFDMQSGGVAQKKQRLNRITDSFMDEYFLRAYKRLCFSPFVGTTGRSHAVLALSNHITKRQSQKF